MNRFKNIMDLLNNTDKEINESVAIAKGKYKFPYTFKEIYKVKKRELKHRKNGKGKGNKAEGRK